MRSIFSGLVVLRVTPVDGSLGLFRGRWSVALAIPFRPSMGATVSGSGSFDLWCGSQLFCRHARAIKKGRHSPALLRS